MFAIYFGGRCFNIDFESFLWLVNAAKDETCTIGEFIKNSISYLINTNELEEEYQTRKYYESTEEDVKLMKNIIANMNQAVTFYFEDIIKTFTIEPISLCDHLLAIETSNHYMFLYWHTTA